MLESYLGALLRFGTSGINHVLTRKNTSISLGNHFEDFIKEEVNTGRYASASEVVRSTSRLLEREEKKEGSLKL